MHDEGKRLSELSLAIRESTLERPRTLPRRSEKNLTSLAWHIAPVTLVAVLLVLVGVSFRAGWFS